MKESATAQHEFILPPSIVTKADVSHLVDEVEKIDNQLTEASIRNRAGVEHQPAITASQKMNDFFQINQLSMTHSIERSQLITRLKAMKDHVPVIHLTFAVEADTESLQQLVQWLRTSIHPQAVVAVGLQPSLIAGVYIRTPNRVHDFSVRAALEGGHTLLVNELEALRVSK